MYELKGNFGEIKDQLECLDKLGIKVIMNDGKFQLEDMERAYAAYKTIVDNKIEGYQVYVEELKKITSFLLLKKAMLDAHDEELIYEKKDDSIIIDGGHKGIVISKNLNDTPFASYEIKFARNLDSKLDKVPFYFKKDDILYRSISSFASKYDNMIQLKDKKIEFLFDEEGIFLIYESELNDSVEQDTIKINSPYDNTNWLNIDFLYDEINSKISKGMMR